MIASRIGNIIFDFYYPQFELFLVYLVLLVISPHVHSKEHLLNMFLPHLLLYIKVNPIKVDYFHKMKKHP